MHKKNDKILAYSQKSNNFLFAFLISKNGHK